MRRFVLNSESVRMCLRRVPMLLTVAVFVALLSAPWADRAHADTLSVRIASGTDDAEEHFAEGGGMDLTSSDQEIGAEGGGADAQWIGYRFLNIDIPRGATINSANIQFTVDETDDEVQTMPIQIFGELGDAATFASSSRNISSRERTGIFVDWEDIPPWPTVKDAGPDQQTPNIGSVIQAIVNQGTWAPNNALVILMSPHAQFERTAESFNGTASEAAFLTIDFDRSNIILFGDFNFDGAIDLADYQILVANFNLGTTFAEGDFTFDGVVDLSDFIGFRLAFEAAAVGGAAVPEPGAMILATMALAGFAGTFRRRR